MKQAIRILGAAITLAALCSSCDNAKKEKQTRNVHLDTLSPDIVDFPLKKFSLPYELSLRTDSNSLIYLKQVPFDTSYMFHIVKEGKIVRGVCYLVLPTNHRDLEDLYGDKDQLLFFSGVSFRLDSLQWRIVRQKTNQLILALPDTLKSSSPCFDCPSYSIIFDNSKRNSRNSEEREVFREYDVFFKDTLLHYFYLVKGRGDAAVNNLEP